MKIKKLLCGLAIANVSCLSITPIVGCSKSEDNKYSKLVQDVVNKLVDMDHYPRCTNANGHREYLDPIRGWIMKECVASGISLANFHIDTYGNVWFDVPASSGYENYKPIIFQGHMDMVVTGLDEAAQVTTPIDVEVEWDKGIVHSKDYKTSLGADNGVALAIIFTLLQDSSFKHGPLRIIFTADEDSGMIGASYIANHSPKLLCNMGNDFSGEKIEYLLNIDWETIGQALKSCTGSTTLTFGSDALQPDASTAFNNKYVLDVKGLKGGHSGEDLVNNRANAEKCIFEILNEFISTYPDSIQLVKHSNINEKGEEVDFKRNSIVPYATLKFNSNQTIDKFDKFIKNKITEWKEKYTGEDWSKVSITINNSDHEGTKHISANNSSEFITKVGKTSTPTSSGADSIWYGYIKNGDDIVKSANVSPINISFNEEDNIFVATATSQIRCQTNQALTEMKKYYENWNIFSDTQPKEASYYPAWYNPDESKNKIIGFVSEGYKQSGMETKIISTNSGIECTWWVKCNPELNLSSIGPNIVEAHSSNETLYIDGIESVLKCVKYTCEQLKK